MLSETEVRNEEAEMAESTGYRSGKPHPLCLLIRELRNAAGWSLSQFQARSGIPAVVVGAYERGDRIPPLSKLEAIFAAFGYKLAAAPVGCDSVRVITDMVGDLRAIANQLEDSKTLFADSSAEE